MTEKKDYSVVIPFYNEEDSITELLTPLTNILKDQGASYEIFAVNDGSTDSTRTKLDEMQKVDPNIIPVHFESNQGQTACLAEGFKRATGDIVVSMDGDLQDDPEELPGMLAYFKESGCDVLCGWRKDRQDPSRTMLISKMGNLFQRLFFNVQVHDISCTFRIYKNEAVKKLNLPQKGLHRFLPFLLKRAGCTLKDKAIRHRSRKHGESKYTVKKAPETVRLFFEILFNKY